MAEPPKALAWKSNSSPNRAQSTSSNSSVKSPTQEKPTSMSAPPQPRRNEKKVILRSVRNTEVKALEHSGLCLAFLYVD